jgi:hypothetical protein
MGPMNAVALPAEPRHERDAARRSHILTNAEPCRWDENRRPKFCFEPRKVREQQSNHCSPTGDGADALTERRRVPLRPDR